MLPLTRPNRLRGFYATLGHHFRVLSVLSEVTLALSLVFHYRIIGVLLMVVFGFAIAGLLANRTAHSGMCERCAHNFPLNPGAMAEKRLRALTLHHRVRTKPFMVAAIAALVAACAMPFPPVLIVALPVFLAVTVTYDLTGRIHDTLTPWCPLCNHGGGGGGGGWALQPIPPRYPVGAEHR